MEQRSKEYFDQRVWQEMAEHLGVRDLSLTEQLAVTARKLALEGHEAGLAGQITARTGEPGTYWTPPMGLGYDEATLPLSSR